MKPQVWLPLNYITARVYANPFKGIWDAMVEEDPRYREAILCEKTQYGWKVIHPDLEGRVKETARLLGKLMKQSITEEEAREMDGLNGRPLWVVIGRRIFDVTSNCPSPQYLTS